LAETNKIFHKIFICAEFFNEEIALQIKSNFLHIYINKTLINICAKVYLDSTKIAAFGNFTEVLTRTSILVYNKQ